MNYICLAAGKGTRFGQLGRYLQKCMYPIALKPFLEYSIANLRHSCMVDLEQDRLILVVGHHQEQVRAYFGSDFEGLAIDYVTQEKALGTGHAVRLACQQYPSEHPSIIWLADAYVPKERFEAIYEHSLDNVLTVARDDDELNDNVRVSFDGKHLSRVWQGESDYFEIGLWKLSPGLINNMVQLNGAEIRALPNIQMAIEAGTEVGFIKANSWLHLGGTQPTPKENVLAVAEQVLALSLESR